MYCKTSDLALEPITCDALPELVRLLTDDVVGKTYMVPDFPTPEAAYPLAERIQALSQQADRFVAGIWLGDRLIGLLNETEADGCCIEIGYAILPEYHNKGYGTQALQAAVQHLLAQGFTQVRAGAFAENTASIRVMEKAGMVLLDKTDTVTYRGIVHQCVYYAAKKETNTGI